MAPDQGETVKLAPAGQPPAAGAELQDRLIAVVRQLAVELRPQRGPSLQVKLDSRLEQDLGFDSLSRAELLFRLERSFKVRLAEEVLGEAETLAHLLAAVLQVVPSSAVARPAAAPVSLATTAAPAEAAPADARTLAEVLDWHCRAHGERTHVVLVDGRDGETTLSYGQLADEARRVARGLRNWGLNPGERVAIMLPTSRTFFIAFYAALYAGGVPTPIYPPARLSRIEEHLRRQAGILRNARASILLTTPEARPLAELLTAQIPSMRGVRTIDELGGDPTGPLPRLSDPQQIALLQYTSGSTGDPKGVVLTHANLLANIRAMGEMIRPTSADVFVSWLPLYHDMGLIGAWLGSLYYAAVAVVMSPRSFLIRPESWLWAIHRHHGTLSAAPNFAFELCVRRVDDAATRGLDLSSLRMIANGSEPVSAATIRRFAERFAPHGFRPQAMTPVYGLAENAVGLAFPPIGRGLAVDRIDRAALAWNGRAAAARADSATAIELVGCGQVLPRHQLRAIDETGREVGDRVEGRLQFRGPSATSGYFESEAKTRALFDGPWLDTGDRGYFVNGELFITGRAKDIIIRAGRHIFPQEVEEAVGDIAGIRKGCVVAFGSTDRRSGTERVVLIAESRETQPAELAQLRRRIEAVTADLLGTPADETVLVAPATVPKTSSGKLRRAATKELYETGRLGVSTRAVWWQFARLAASSAAPRLRRAMHALGELLYAGYWWSVIALIGGITWPLVVLAPRRHWRWAILGRMARWALRLTATPLHIEGAPDAANKPGVLIANHASYLDGLVIAAAVPGEKVFVAKRELTGKPFARLFLEALGTMFVDRFDAEGGVEDTQRILAAARAGQRLVFFPEGTLSRTPGLLEFRLGAFSVAAQADVPVVPIVIVGTRAVLRGDQWFPRRGAVRLVIGTPLSASGRDFPAILRLRDMVRQVVLSRCGEPDLAGG